MPDAEHLELPDDTADGVLGGWGYMLMPDPAAALRELTVGFVSRQA